MSGNSWAGKHKKELGIAAALAAAPFAFPALAGAMGSATAGGVAGAAGAAGAGAGALEGATAGLMGAFGGMGPEQAAILAAQNAGLGPEANLMTLSAANTAGGGNATLGAQLGGLLDRGSKAYGAAKELGLMDQSQIPQPQAPQAQAPQGQTPQVYAQMPPWLMSDMERRKRQGLLGDFYG